MAIKFHTGDLPSTITDKSVGIDKWWNAVMRNAMLNLKSKRGLGTKSKKIGGLLGSNLGKIEEHGELRKKPEYLAEEGNRHFIPKDTTQEERYRALLLRIQEMKKGINRNLPGTRKDRTQEKRIENPGEYKGRKRVK